MINQNNNPGGIPLFPGPPALPDLQINANPATPRGPTLPPSALPGSPPMNVQNPEKRAIPKLPFRLWEDAEILRCKGNFNECLPKLNRSLLSVNKRYKKLTSLSPTDQDQILANEATKSNYFLHIETNSEGQKVLKEISTKKPKLGERNNRKKAKTGEEEEKNDMLNKRTPPNEQVQEGVPKSGNKQPEQNDRLPGVININFRFKDSEEGPKESIFDLLSSRLGRGDDFVNDETWDEGREANLLHSLTSKKHKEKLSSVLLKQANNSYDTLDELTSRTLRKIIMQHLSKYN